MPVDKSQTYVYVLYTLDIDGGLCDKYGPLIEDSESEIIFKTQSEVYRIKNEESIERKQKDHWHYLGSIKNLQVRETETKTTKRDIL